MSRSGYSDDCTNWALICWRGAVASAIRGKRGQAFLQELADALDAMPVKRLIADEFEFAGEVCALGALVKARGMDTAQFKDDNSDPAYVSKHINAPRALVAEIEFENDEDFRFTPETPEQRWSRMRQWVASQIRNAMTGNERQHLASQ